MRVLLRRRPRGPIAVLLAVWLLVCASLWAFTIAISVYAFERSGAGAVGAATAARLLPAMFVAPLAGRLLDSAERTRVVVTAVVVQVACLAGAAALVLGHASLVAIVVLAALGNLTTAASRPGLQSLMPALAADPEELARATAAWGAIDNAGFLLGSAAGAAALAAVGAGGVVAGAAGLCAAGGLLATRLPRARATVPDEPDADEAGLADALAGVRAVVRSRLLRAPFALLAGLLVLEGTTDVQLVALALGKLHMGTGGPGVLYAVWGLGGLLGSAAIAAFVRRRGYGLALAAGAGAFAAGLAAAGLDGVAVAVVALALAGFGYALVETGVVALVPRLADDAIVGRVYALSEALYGAGAGAGALLAPLLIAALGAAGSLELVGGAFALGAALSLPGLARVDAGQQEATRIRNLLRGIGFLAPLPLPRLERLVRAARPVSFAAGETVIRAGDRGDDFFVLAQGSVDVVEQGVRLGPGDGFGEIALLRDVPRTATVRAAEDLRLWALARRSFLAAVTGHGEASSAADALVNERLARRPLAHGADPPAGAGTVVHDPSAAQADEAASEPPAVRGAGAPGASG